MKRAVLDMTPVPNPAQALLKVGGRLLASPAPSPLTLDAQKDDHTINFDTAS